MMKAIVQVDGKSQNINFFNLHAKCCNAAERRRADADFLFDELKRNYNDDNMVIMGDYNETYSMSKGAYAPWFANWNGDYLRAAGSTLDQVSISNELYFEFQSLTNNIRIDRVNYSDHNPVMLRLIIDSDKEKQVVSLNPVGSQQIGNIVQLHGTTNSGLPVKYSVVAGNAIIVEDMLEVTGSDPISVQAFQEGNHQYAPAFSEWVTFNVDETTDVMLQYAHQVDIYPNPTSHSVVITMPYVGEKDIRILDLKGKVCKSFRIDGNQQTIAVDDLSAGAYMVQIISGNKSITRKLVIK